MTDKRMSEKRLNELRGVNFLSRSKAWPQWSIGDEPPVWRLIRNDIATNRPEFVGAFPGQRP